MLQSIIELTSLTPTPDNYILYHHLLQGKDYFSLKSKINSGTHFTFEKLENLSINNVVFNTAEGLINAFNTNFNTAEYVPEEIANKQNNLNPDSTNNKYPTVTAVIGGLSQKVDKVTGKSLISDAEIARLANVENYDGSGKVNKETGKSLILDTLITKIVNLNKRTSIVNADYTADVLDRTIVTSATLTAPRIVTLNELVPIETEIIVADDFQAINGVNFLVIKAPLGRKLNGVINGTETIRVAGGWRRFLPDGNGNYTFDAGIIRQNSPEFANKLDTGGYVGTAEALRLLIVNATTGVTGTSIVPTSPAPGGSGVASWIAVQSGTYTNYGGFTVATNSIAVISRSASNVFSITQTAFDVSNKINVSDVINVLTSTDAAKPLSANQGRVLDEKIANGVPNWSAAAYLVNNEVTHLGKLWRANTAIISTDIPGVSSKWEDALSGYVVKASNITRGDELFNYAGYVNASGVFVPQVSNNVVSDFIELTPTDTFTATNLQSSTTLFRQATFFNSAKVFISAYTSDNLTSISLNSANIPTNTAFVVLNRNKTVASTIIVKNGIKSNLEISQNLAEIGLNKENTYKLETGVNLFTITGFYVNKTTGALDANASFKCTDYIELNSSNTIIATGLAIAGAFRQASFFSSKSANGLISSYTTNDLSNITLDFNNIPSTARYVRFNTTLASTPILTAKKYNYSSVAPLKVETAAWDTINPTSGYSSHYGKGWFGSSFTNNNDFQFMVYTVTAGQTIHVRGNSDTGNNPIVVFFNSESIDAINFVANGTIPVINGVKFYNDMQVVPVGATHAIVQQRRLLKLEPPFAELVRVTDNNELKKKKVVLIGDSFTQMAGYAGEELMTLIKPLYPEYDIFNYGVGGEKTNEILSRVGAFQMYLTPSDTFTLIDTETGNRYFTLPATTATVEIGADSISNSWNNGKLNLLAQTTPTKDCAPQTVLIENVECLLTKVGSSYFLSRIVAGASTRKVFVGSEIISYNIPKLNEDDIAIVNTHQNGGWVDVNDLVAQVQRLVDSLGTKKYIVLSSHYAQTTTPANLDSVTNRIVQETALRKAFGAKYINMREYFTTRAVIDALATPWWNNNLYPTDTVGQTHPTASDITHMSTGRFAPMFWCNSNNGADIIHLSRRSYLIYYAFIFKKMTALKYFL